MIKIQKTLAKYNDQTQETLVKRNNIISFNYPKGNLSQMVTRGETEKSNLTARCKGTTHKQEANKY